MAPNPRRIAAKLDELYAQLPAIDCQGLCVDSCGPIPAGEFERRRMESASGRKLTADKVFQSLENGQLNACHECSMMENGRCAVYDVRPAICRLWGVAEDLRCPYGCEPERVLTVAEGYAFLAEAYAIAGWPAGAERFAKEEIKALVDNPQARRAIINHHRPTLAGRRGSLPLTVIEKGTRL
jgi:Fe-S-cluster containining protein